MSRSGFSQFNETQFRAFIAGLTVAAAKRSAGNMLFFSLPVGLMSKMINEASLRSKRHCGIPYLAVTLSREFAEFIEEEYELVYPVNAGNLYFELIENGKLLIKYQFILGYRHVMTLDERQMALLYSTLVMMVSRLDKGNPTVAFDAALDKVMGEVQLVLGGMRVAPENSSPQVELAPSATVTTINTEIDAIVVELRMMSAQADRILLPPMHLRHYAEIKRRITKAGGKYNSGGYFLFPAGIDAQSVLDDLCGNKVVNGKKDSQSFFTPAVLGQQLVCELGPLADKRVLEPSAGDGALADLVRSDAGELVLIENYPVNIHALKAKGYTVLERDFMTVTPAEIGLFDVVLGNPPFAGSADIVHIRHMVRFLKPGGVLSVIGSTRWMTGNQRQQVEFRTFLNSYGARIREVPAGMFKGSGTTVATTHITLVTPSMELAAAA